MGEDGLWETKPLIITVSVISFIYDEKYTSLLIAWQLVFFILSSYHTHKIPKEILKKSRDINNKLK